MKTKLKELRDKSTEELLKEIAEKGQHIFNLRSQSVTEKLEDPTQIRKAKRDVARLKTLIREREIAAAKSETK